MASSLHEQSKDEGPSRPTCPMVLMVPLGLLGCTRRSDTPSPEFRADPPGSHLQLLIHVSYLGLLLPPKTIGPGRRLHTSCLLVQAPSEVSVSSVKPSITWETAQYGGMNKCFAVWPTGVRTQGLLLTGSGALQRWLSWPWFPYP